MTEQRTNTASRRNTASQRTGSGSHRSGGGRGRKNKHSSQDTMWLAIGGLIVIGLLIAILLVSGKNKENTKNTVEETSAEAASETEETLSDEVVYGDYVLDLTGIKGFPQDARINVRDKSRAEIYSEAAKLYTWSMKITNGSADVGNVVKPTVDVNATTEAATMGDAENPDSAVENTEGVAALTEITVSKSIDVPDLVNPVIRQTVEEIFADDMRTKNEKHAKVKAKEKAKETETAEKKKGKKQKETEAESTEPESSSDEQDSMIFFAALGDVSAEIEEVATFAEDMWYEEAKGEGIGSFDKTTEKFLMEGAKDGSCVDKEKLIAMITEAIDNGDFEKAIEAPVEKIPSASAQKNGEYQIIGTFTTKTTNNAVRNKNISLACQALNGTIVRAGEEFSYNNTIGERTAEKGYGAAAAYLNGEVVQEIGGGVCQVSSTLYNAVLKAGLKTTKRTSHTFKPTYVTPGEDATVSWGGPDYRFANLPSQPDLSYDNTFAIGILAHYSDNTVTVSIYGRPVLKPGYSLSLESVQTGEKEIVRVLIPPEDTEKEPTTGDKGSSWKTYLIVKKDGTEVSKNEDHNTYYSGHTEYYRETEATSETESSSEETESYTGPIGPGMPSDAYNQLISGNPSGPGQSSTESTIPETSAQDAQQSPGGNAESPMIVDAPGGGGNAPGGGVPVAGPGSDDGGNFGDTPGGPGGIIQNGP